MMPLQSYSRISTTNSVFSISLLLLLAHSTQERVFIQDRSKFMKKMLPKEEEGNGMPLLSSVIGSRPPQCEKRCIACGQYESVQVPAARQKEEVSMRVEENSNYKPVNWKCNCGDLIFDP